jgi:hypothetical protein
MNTYIIDTECYKNYWLFLAVNHKTGSSLEIELFGEDAKLNEQQAKKIQRLFLNHETVSFNGLNYDIPVIHGALDAWDCKKLHKLSTKIITDQRVTWQILKEHNLQVPTYDKHIDIIEIPIGQASLKIYGGRIHTKKMQDLPIDPNELIKDTDRSLMRKYCRNDTQVTGELFDKLKGQIDLRKEMTQQYGINLNSKSDAQIAEAIIKSELQKMYDMSATKFKAKQYENNHVFRYSNPKIIEFKLEKLKSIFNRLINQEFIIGDNGAIICPDWLGERIVIGETVYQMGIGGIHSCEKAQHIKRENDFVLREQDVTGFYPNIIMQQRLYPDNLGKNFLKLYEKIVKQRTIAKKRSGEIKKELEILKLQLK